MKVRDFDNATTQRKPIKRRFQSYHRQIRHLRSSLAGSVRKKVMRNSTVSRKSDEENAGGIHGQLIAVEY
jgi:hypothetical protein